MIGWYDARMSLLSDVVTSRWKGFRCLLPFCGITIRSLWGKQLEYPSCSPSAGHRSRLMLPMGGESGIGQGWRSVCTQLDPFPYNGAQSRDQLKEPCKKPLASLAGGCLLQAKDSCRCKLCSLSKHAPGLEPNYVQIVQLQSPPWEH